MATRETATEPAIKDSSAALRHRRGRRALFLAGALAWVSANPANAASNNVRITGLTDLAFGTIANLSVDAVRSEDVCAYSNTTANGYRVTATGSGSGGAFSLSSGAGSLAYEVQWSQTPGQTNGSQLLSNVALTGQISSATQQTCNAGPSSSASLIVILRSASLSGATAGSYSGTLTLLIGPE